MAKDIVIRGNELLNCPEVSIPTVQGGTAQFVDTSDATLDNGNKMLAGVTSYADGVKYTGTIPNKSASDLTASGATVTVPAGHYPAQATKSVANGTVTAPASISGTSATVTPGTNTLTISKTVSVTPNVTAAGYIASGTAGNSAISLTASVPTKAASTITPGTSAQEISAGTYLTGKQTIAGDTNLKGQNIVDGVSIFGVAGSAKVPVIYQDQTTGIVYIS